MLASRIRTRPLFQAIRLRALHKESHSPSTKGSELFVASTFPDNFDAPEFISERQKDAQTVRMGKWEEMNASTSEASIKADRGEIQEATPAKKKDVILEEAPRLDEM
ncbi:hypothetical protein ASPZODRAFT_18005 [Penicilliopsis zonata CBS 506.65]|uniref:Uncharacterized protein n=1 Tax=Penicilliopsis zonata CBS 506.65 TaxID=1073090 RepID=A0A1L9SCZ7_9EURO|nr:hypothetical protein ASPZODRAFT_18005 [Penicilliopsis zonata CBS 506.65]OJJ45095.1 hypothetical protein ASPZODRAFT_18005 [Penicilliopsis zonata CBS 506.65]